MFAAPAIVYRHSRAVNSDDFARISRAIRSRRFRRHLPRFVLYLDATKIAEAHFFSGANFRRILFLSTSCFHAAFCTACSRSKRFKRISLVKASVFSICRLILSRARFRCQKYKASIVAGEESLTHRFSHSYDMFIPTECNKLFRFFLLIYFLLSVFISSRSLCPSENFFIRIIYPGLAARF